LAVLFFKLLIFFLLVHQNCTDDDDGDDDDDDELYYPGCDVNRGLLHYRYERMHANEDMYTGEIIR